jgi:tRNA (Thr-GGU) A37 N-methylase
LGAHRRHAALRPAVDIVDGTPLLDIKPYVPRFDWRDGATSGWLAENLDRLEGARDDGRFLP